MPKLLKNISKRTLTTDGRGRTKIWRRARTRPMHRNDMASAGFARSRALEPNHTAYIPHSSEGLLSVRHHRKLEKSTSMSCQPRHLTFTFTFGVTT